MTGQIQITRSAGLTFIIEVQWVDWFPPLYSLTKNNSIGTDEMKVTSIHIYQNRNNEWE